MDIYVNKFPDCCVQCPLCCADYKGELYCKQLDETFKPNIEVVDYNKRKENCPLKLLSDRLAEERKKVVQEIRNYMENHSHIVPVVSKKRNVIYKIGLTRFLDHIERGDVK